MKKTFRDDLGRLIEIAYPPRRIVSLVPSQTELLFDLGLEQEVVGITKFCIHPDHWFREKKRVGGTKNPDLKKIRSIQPDLILCNKEENEINSLTELSHEFPVWISDIKNLGDALRMISAVGEMTNRVESSQKIMAGIEDRFHQLPTVSRPIRAAYLIWNEPIMTINSDTFIHDMMRHCGFENVFGEKTDSRYPIISIADLQIANPEILLLPSEPFPFKDDHRLFFQSKLPACDIRLADGEMMSWYGSRLLKFDFQQMIGERH